MNDTITVKIGDVVLFVGRYAKRPVKVNVSHVTPKGWIRFTYADGKESATYKPARYAEGWEDPSKFSDGRVYPLSSLERLTKDADDYEAMKGKERELEKARKAEAAAKDATKLAAVKTAMGNSLLPWIASKTVLPDGSRLYVLNVPVGPEHVERKKGYEVAILRCVEEEDTDWNTMEKSRITRYYMTWCNGSTSSFASCSGEKAESDEAALWEAARYLYHR